MLHDPVRISFIKADVHAALFAAVLDRILHLVSVVKLFSGREDLFHAGADLVFREMSHTYETVSDHALFHLKLAFVGRVLDLTAAAARKLRAHGLAAVLRRLDLPRLDAICHVVFPLGDTDPALFAGKHVMDEDFHAFFLGTLFLDAHNAASLIGNADTSGG